MFIQRFRELIRQGVADPFPCPEGGGKGGGGSQLAPDYTGAAIAQGAANEKTLTQQTWANRPTLNTPWGQMSWGAQGGTDPSTGQPVTQWTGSMNLSGQQQEALDDQMALQAGRSDLASSFMDRVRNEYATPFSYAGMTALAGTPQAEKLQGGQGIQQGLNTSNLPQMPGSMEAQQKEAYRRMQEFQAPERSFQEEALRTRLANQGLDPGSSAYATALRRQGDQFARQDQQNLQASFGEGREQGQYQAGLRGQGFGEALQGGQFGNQAQQQAFAQAAQAGQQNWAQGLQGAEYQNRLRQQQIAEEAQRRGMSLNEMNALLSGQQVAMPNMPAFAQAGQAQAPNLLGAATAQGQYQQGQDQLAQSGGFDWGSAIGGIGSVAAIAM